jgi:hypothetical protein
MISTVPIHNNTSAYSRYRPLGFIFCLIFVASTLLSCMSVSRRPLSINDAKIVIASVDAEETKKLEKACRRGARISNAPTEDVSLKGTFRAISGSCLEPVLVNDDDLRKCAGEHGAQVVQVIGSEKKTERMDGGGHLTLGIIAGIMAPAAAWSGGVASSIGSQTMATQAWSNSIKMQEMAVTEIAAAQNTSDGTITRTTALDLQFWQCPASRAIPKKGELVARWPHSSGDWSLEVIRDGQMVSSAQDDFKGLSHLVSAYPPAIEHAKRAEHLAGTATTNLYIIAASAITFIVATGVGVAGFFTHEPLVLWPSVGVMGVSLPLVFIFGPTSANAGRECATEAVNAIDSYNENYIHTDQVVFSRTEETKAPVNP